MQRDVGGIESEEKGGGGEDELMLLPEVPHKERPPVVRYCQPTYLPTFLMHTCPKVSYKERSRGRTHFP